VSSRDARLNTTAVHLRLALPQVRAALRQLRDMCAAHAEGSNAVIPSSDAETGLASAFAAERFSSETRSESAAFAAQLKTLASQLMEMDAEALRACCKQVVDAVRKLLAVTGKKSSERTQLATLLFSLSRYLPLVISIEAGEAAAEAGAGAGAGAPSERGGHVSTSAAAHAAAMREHAKTVALVEEAAASAAPPPPEPAEPGELADPASAETPSPRPPPPPEGTTPGESARAAARVIASLRGYAAAVSEWQTALVDDELRADAALGLGGAHAAAQGKSAFSGADDARDLFSGPASFRASPFATRPVPRRPAPPGHLPRTMSVGVMAQYLDGARVASGAGAAEGGHRGAHVARRRRGASVSGADEDEREQDLESFAEEAERSSHRGEAALGVAPASPSARGAPENESRERLSFPGREEAEEAAPRGSAAEEGDGATRGGSRPLSYAGALGVTKGGGPRPPRAPPDGTGPASRHLSPRRRPPYLSVAAGASREVSAPRASAERGQHRDDAAAPPAAPASPRAARPWHRRRLSDDFPDTLAPAPPRDRYLRGGERLRPYRDALLPPPRERGERGESFSMLAQVLAKNAAAAAVSLSPASTPPASLLGFAVSQPHAGKAASGSAFPESSAPSSSRSTSPRHSASHSAPKPGAEVHVLANAHFATASRPLEVPEGHIVCRMCEKPVEDAAVPEHSRCCAAMRDADLRALAAGADIAARIAAAAAAMAEVLEREPEESGEKKAAFARIRDASERAAETLAETETDDFVEVVSSLARAFGDAAASARAAGHVATEIAATHVRDALLDASGTDTSARYAPSARLVSGSRASFETLRGSGVSGGSDSGSHSGSPSASVDDREKLGVSTRDDDDRDATRTNDDDSSPRASPGRGRGPVWGAHSVPGSPARDGGGAARGGGAAPSIEDFEVLKRVSSGAYGKVYLCRKRTTGDVYAVKVIRKKDLVYKNMISQAMAERDALIQTDNPFIVKLYYTFASARHLYIVTEYAVGGDLYSLLRQLGRLGEDHCRQYAAEIVLALEYCHARGIIHRDLKPDNLLVTAAGHVKLTDFGLSNVGIARDAGPRDAGERGGATASSRERFGSRLSVGSAFGRAKDAQTVAGASSSYAASGYGSDAAARSERGSLGGSRTSSVYDYSHSAMQPRSSLGSGSIFRHADGAKDAPGLGASSAVRPGVAKGTPDYLAPEVLLCEPYGPEVDWWALGVVVFELLVGVPPFHAASPVKIFENILSNDIAWPPEPAPKKPPNARAAAAAAADADAGSDADSDDAGLSGAARDFIRALLRPEVDDRLGTRLGAAEVKAHPFFAGVDWDGIQSACEREHEADEPAFVPAFVPKPEDALDTSYFAEKPRASAREQPKSARPRRARRHSLGATSRTSRASTSTTNDDDVSFADAPPEAQVPAGTGTQSTSAGLVSPVAAVAGALRETDCSHAPRAPLGAARRFGAGGARAPLRRPRRSSLGTSSLGNLENYASSLASSRAASEAASSDDEAGAAASLRRSVRSMLGPPAGGGALAGAWRSPPPGLAASPTRPNRHMGSSSQASLDAHAHGSHGSGSRSPTWRAGIPADPRASPGRVTTVRPSSLHPGHSAAAASPSARVSLGSPPVRSPNRSPSPFEGSASSGRSEADIIVGQLSASDSETERGDARGAKLSSDSDVSSETRGSDVSASDSTSGSGTGSSAADAEAVTREAALLKDFAYVNLSELARENANALSRGNTPRVSVASVRETTLPPRS
jgi:serine/threonine protein kinase